MRRLISLSALAAIFVWGAAAQDSVTEIKGSLEKMIAEAKMMGPRNAVMGATVKGAPYSGEEVGETTQMLADGTRIHHENHTMVYRDSEGRVRRETPESVTIWDPVAKTSYMLNPKDQTARQMGMAFFFSKDGGNGVVTYTTRTPEPKGANVGVAVSGGWQEVAEVKMTVRDGVAAATSGEFVRVKLPNPKGQSESLGKRNIEGVNSDGTRQVTTFEVGSIGNDRPIEVTYERWYSEELQTTMLTRRNDPRTGEEVSRLINVSRAEPASYLFQVPAGYQVIQNK